MQLINDVSTKLNSDWHKSSVLIYTGIIKMHDIYSLKGRIIAQKITNVPKMKSKSLNTKKQPHQLSSR